MKAKVGTAQKDLDKEVLGELALLVQGRHASQQTLLERYRRCSDWKQACVIICRALGDGRARRQSAYLTPPPGWLPPTV